MAAPRTLRHHRRGFTLVELMIVIVIVAVLAAIGVASYFAYVDNARQSQAEAFLAVIRGKQEVYGSRFGRFLTAPANPAAAPVPGGKSAWVANQPAWLALGADPKAGNVGWQYETGGASGACAAGGGAGHPPADLAAACAGLTSGTWWWASARNTEATFVTNSARGHVWKAR